MNNRAETVFEVGQTVSFTSDIQGLSGEVKHHNYALGVIERVGKRLSVRVR